MAVKERLKELSALHDILVETSRGDRPIETVLQRIVERLPKVRYGAAYELELQAIRKGGAVRICPAHGEPELDQEGRVTRLIGSLQESATIIRPPLTSAGCQKGMLS